MTLCRFCAVHQHNFDMGGAYTAFVRLIEDSQQPDGNVQDCVPWYGHGPSLGSFFITGERSVRTFS